MMGQQVPDKYAKAREDILELSQILREWNPRSTQDAKRKQAFETWRKSVINQILTRQFMLERLIKRYNQILLITSEDCSAHIQASQILKVLKELR